MNFHGGAPKTHLKQKLVDFSVNIPPFDAPEGLTDCFKEAITHLSQYPEINSESSRLAVSQHLGLKTDQVLIGNGATELIYLMGRWMSQKRILILEPTFTEYQRAFEASGCHIHHLMMPMDENEPVALRDIQTYVTEKAIDLLVICNPNNPTGRLHALEWLEALLDECQIPTMIDESFIELTQDIQMDTWQKTLNRLIEKHKLFVMRSMTKTFCVPGLRIAYAFGNADLIEALNALKEPWSVNTFAQMSIPFLIGQQAYLENMKQWQRKHKAILVSSLSGFSNLKVYQGRANFVLIQVNKPHHEHLLEKLIEKGLYIRPCEDFYGLDDSFFRIAVRGEQETHLLINKIAEALNEKI